MTRVYILFLFIISSTFLYSQQYSGVVLDSISSEPIQNAMVLCFDDNENIIDHVMTDENGQFKIKNYSKCKKLSFNSINYESKKKATKLIHENIVKLKYSEKKALLDEVVIKAKASYLVSSNDTVRIKADLIKNKNDRTLEDLFDRIPGISVNIQTGEIKFENKSISKIIIDGDDLTGNSYEMISKNLSQEIADEIEILKNYSENKITQDFDRTNKVAINIKTKDRYRNKINGSMNVSAGNATDDRLNLFYVSSFKNLTHMSYNNTGNYSFGNILFKNSEFENLNEIFQTDFTNIVWNSLINNKFKRVNAGYVSNLTENEDLTLSQNILFSISNKVKIKINSGLYNDDLTKTNHSKTIDLYNDEILQEDKNFNKFQPKNYFINLKIEANPKKHIEYKGVFLFSKRKHLFKNYGLTNNYQNNQKSDGLNNNLNIINKLSFRINSKKALLFGSKISISYLEDKLNYLFSIPHYNYIIDNFISESSQYIINSKLNTIDNEIGVLTKINNRNYFSVLMRHSMVSLANINSLNSSSLNSIHTEKNTYTNFETIFKFSQFNKKSKFNVEGSLNVINNNQTKFLPEVVVNYERTFKLNRITAFFEKKINKPRSFLFFSNIPYQLNSNSFFKKENKNIFGDNFSCGLVYNRYFLSKKSSLGFDFQYNFIKKPWIINNVFF